MEKYSILFLALVLSQLSFSQKEIECDRFQTPVGKYIVIEKGTYNNSAFGIIDTIGNIIFETKFTYDKYKTGAPHFKIFDDMIFEYNKEKNLYRFINLNSKESITDFEIISFKNFENGYAIIQKYDAQNKKGFFDNTVKNLPFYFIDKQGKVVCKLPKDASNSLEYSNHGSFYNGLAKIKFIINDGKSISNDLLYGYIDKSGKTTIKPSYISANNFYEGLAAVQIEKENGLKQWGFINKQGNVVIDFKYSIEPSSFSDGLSIVTTKNRKKGFIDKTGKIVIQPTYNEATGFYKGYAIVKKEYKAPYELINTKGVTLHIFSKVRKFIYFGFSRHNLQRNNFIKHYINNNAVIAFLHGKIKPQVIDFKEKILFDNNQYNKIEKYSSGLSKMSKYDKTTKTRTDGFINKKGEFVIIKSQNQF